MTLTQPELKELLKNIPSPMYNTIANHNPVNVTGTKQVKIISLCGKNCDV
jgi:hypothetical protein